MPERLQEPPQCHGVLAGEKVRRGEQRTLPPRVRDESQGQGSHCGLARSNVALKQSHHRPRLGQVGHDRLNCRALVRGQPGRLGGATGPDLFGQRRLHGLDRLLDTLRRHGDRLTYGNPPLPVPRHHSDLQRQELVEAEAAQGGVSPREILRVMDAFQRGRDRQRPARFTRVHRPRFGRSVLRIGCADHVERLTDRPPESRRRQPRGEPVDGDDPTGVQ